MSRKYPPAQARFWQQTQKGKDDECWLWTGASQKNYGTFTVDGKLVRSHRFSWTLHRGPIPQGLEVLHQCDNPRCVNPNHLFIGSHRDNMQDCVSKARNEQKLTAAAVAAIKSKYAQGKTSQRKLAAEYGVKQAAIWWILHHSIKDKYDKTDTKDSCPKGC